MSQNILDRVLLPVASEEDARTTCERALPKIAEADGTVICAHVVVKGGGSIDPVSPTQQEEQAEAIFEVVTEECETASVPVETRVLYGEDVPETIFEAAEEADASSIAFIPRESNRLFDILSGGTAYSLMGNANRPVVIFPSE